MNSNILKYSLRYSNKNRTFSIINLAGLILGISSSLLIYAYVSFELSFDDFHRQGSDIYRVLGVDEALGINNNNVGIVMAPLGPAMVSEIAQVESIVRIQVQSQGRSLVTVDNESFYTEFAISAEPSLFEVFDFELLQGAPGVMLSEPATAVITEPFAQTLFRDDDPVGKVIRVNNARDIEIVGVAAASPANSHLQFDLITSFMLSSDASEQRRQGRENWGSISTNLYAKLTPGSNESRVETQLTEILNERGTMVTFGATLQPLRDAHLGSTDTLFDGLNNRKGNADQVYILATVAVFILLIAAFNFMNLSTARSSTRAKEVGIRKVNGASRLELAMQFMLDSLLHVIVASTLSLILVLAVGPLLDFPVEINFSQQLFPDLGAVVFLLSGLLGLALIAGSYPAFVLSGLPTISVLKERFLSTSSGRWLRWCLVVIQFGLSIGIIIGMLVVSDQLSFMKNKDVGFEREGIINIRLQDPVLRTNYEALKTELQAMPEIQALATSSNMPGLGYGRTGVRPEGSDPDDFWIMSVVNIDANYLDAMNMKLLEGRGYSESISSDVDDAVMLNASAVKAIGWESAIGRTLGSGENQRTIVGVVEDFHFTNMRHEIEPLILNYSPDGNGFLSLRVSGSELRSALGKIETVWRQVNPDHPFEYSFFADDFDNLFNDDEEFSLMLFQFTFIAIVVACLGLYGLASFSADQKTKEIGIRKVLGAPVSSIILLVMKEYGVLILLANILAWPIMWLVLDAWLSGFVYRIDLALPNFVLASLATALIAAATVSREIYRVVSNNPVQALRYE